MQSLGCSVTRKGISVKVYALKRVINAPKKCIYTPKMYLLKPP